LKDLTIKNRRIMVNLLTSEERGIAYCDPLFISKHDIDKWAVIFKKETFSNLILVGQLDNLL
ncbi:hypothetical protein V6255_18390, partial [Psychromonas arctica]